MDSLFRDLVNEGKIVIYIDDILIFSKTLTKHRVIVKRVLKILNNNKLSVQTKKCRFHQTRIDYLDIIISKDSIEVDPEKIKGVTDWLLSQSLDVLGTTLDECLGRTRWSSPLD